MGGAGEAPRSVTFDTIAAGVVSGLYRCGGKAYPAYVWTLPVDGKQKSLGIRDDRLVNTDHTGPLGQLLSADVEDRVRLTILERTETISMSRSPVPPGWFRFQRFFTFCDAAAADPLDCSVGAARIKGARTDDDTDLDGYLDISRHEISFYDGADRLHFMSFVMPWTGSVTADAYVLIEALNAMSDALQPTELASVVP